MSLTRKQTNPVHGNIVSPPPKPLTNFEESESSDGSAGRVAEVQRPDAGAADPSFNDAFVQSRSPEIEQSVNDPLNRDKFPNEKVLLGQPADAFVEAAAPVGKPQESTGTTEHNQQPELAAVSGQVTQGENREASETKAVEKAEPTISSQIQGTFVGPAAPTEMAKPGMPAGSPELNAAAVIEKLPKSEDAEAARKIAAAGQAAASVAKTPAELAALVAANIPVEKAVTPANTPAVEAVSPAKTPAVEAVTPAKTPAVEAVTPAKTPAVEAVIPAKTPAVEAVTPAKTPAVEAVTPAKTLVVEAASPAKTPAVEAAAPKTPAEQAALVAAKVLDDQADLPVVKPPAAPATTAAEIEASLKPAVKALDPAVKAPDPAVKVLDPAVKPPAATATTAAEKEASLKLAEKPADPAVKPPAPTATTAAEIESSLKPAVKAPDPAVKVADPALKPPAPTATTAAEKEASLKLAEKPADPALQASDPALQALSDRPVKHAAKTPAELEALALKPALKPPDPTVKAPDPALQALVEKPVVKVQPIEVGNPGLEHNVIPGVAKDPKVEVKVDKTLPSAVPLGVHPLGTDLQKIKPADQAPAVHLGGDVKALPSPAPLNLPKATLPAERQVDVLPTSGGTHPADLKSGGRNVELNKENPSIPSSPSFPEKAAHGIERPSYPSTPVNSLPKDLATGTASPMGKEAYPAGGTLKDHSGTGSTAGVRDLQAIAPKENSGITHAGGSREVTSTGGPTVKELAAVTGAPIKESSSSGAGISVTKDGALVGLVSVKDSGSVSLSKDSASGHLSFAPKDGLPSNIGTPIERDLTLTGTAKETLNVSPLSGTALKDIPSGAMAPVGSGRNDDSRSALVSLAKDGTASISVGAIKECISGGVNVNRDGVTISSAGLAKESSPLGSTNVSGMADGSAMGTVIAGSIKDVAVAQATATIKDAAASSAFGLGTPIVTKDGATSATAGQSVKDGTGTTVIGVTKELSVKVEGSVRDGAARIPLSADAGARPGTESTLRPLTEKRGEGLPCTDASTKAPAVPGSGPIQNVFISLDPSVKGSKVTDGVPEKNLDTSTTAPRTPNPILVTTSNGTTPTNATGQPPTGATTAAGVVIDPSQIPIVLPTVQIVLNGVLVTATNVTGANPDPTVVQINPSTIPQIPVAVPVDPNTGEPAATQPVAYVQAPQVQQTEEGVVFATSAGWLFIAGGEVREDFTVVGPNGELWVPTASGEYVQVTSEPDPSTVYVNSNDYAPTYYDPTDLTINMPFIDRPLSIPFVQPVQSVVDNTINLVNTIVESVSTSPRSVAVAPELPVVQPVAQPSVQPVVQQIDNSVPQVQQIANTLTQVVTSVQAVVNQVTEIATNINHTVEVLNESIPSQAQPLQPNALTDWFGLSDQDPVVTAANPSQQVTSIAQQPNQQFPVQHGAISENAPGVSSNQNQNQNQNQSQNQNQNQNEVMPQPDITYLGSSGGSNPLVGSVELTESPKSELQNENGQAQQSQPTVSSPSSNIDEQSSKTAEATKDTYVASGDGRVEATFVSANTPEIPWQAQSNEGPSFISAEQQSENRRQQLLQEEAERRAEQLREDRERADKLREQLHEQERRIREVLLAELATKKAQSMVANQIRRKYIIKTGDTLESIAISQLKDKHLALLIYQINKLSIRVELQAGKQLPRLKDGMSIYLPSGSDIAIFRSNLTNRSRCDVGISDGEVSKRPLSSLSDVRREALERLLGNLQIAAGTSSRIHYTARIGDTLQSIARRHPALQDSELWVLLAELNNLSTETDVYGTPFASAQRGASLILPTADEISKFRKARPIPTATEKVLAS